MQIVANEPVNLMRANSALIRLTYELLCYLQSFPRSILITVASVYFSFGM